MANFTINRRARLGPTRQALDTVLGDLRDCDNILNPLRLTSGIIFPYTPTVMFGTSANYGNFHFTHSNYPYYQYQNSQPDAIQLTGTFTAQTNEEARYMLAVLRFLRGATMIEFGTQAAQKGKAGTPPPVLRFNYMGAHMFNNTPVVVQAVNYILEPEVDYVEVQLPGNLDSSEASVTRAGADGQNLITVHNNKTYLPTTMTLTVVLYIQPNPKDIRDNFDLEDFKSGALVGRGYI